MTTMTKARVKGTIAVTTDDAAFRAESTGEPSVDDDNDGEDDESSNDDDRADRGRCIEQAP